MAGNHRVVLLLIICLMITAELPSVFAHYTLGRPTNLVPFRLHDFDLEGHVAGVTGYVWPGAGLATLDPTNQLVRGDTFTAFPPGYQSPFTKFGPPTFQPTQVASDSYSPFGSILTSTADHADVGDLLFAINFTCPPHPLGCKSLKHDFNFSSIALYLPPEFLPPVNWAGGDTSNIVTTVTNDYASISVRKNDGLDALGPYWWTVFIQGHIRFAKAHNFEEWYYFRLNRIAAPTIAGRYFFKIFLNSTFPARSTVADGGKVSPLFSAMPAENWPVLLVKGEDDPAIMFGTIRYGGFNETLYGNPIQVPGMVKLVGIATDPYTGISTGRGVEAWGFFNASARGRYEVEGIAPGVYQVYASAAGFPEQLVAENVSLAPNEPDSSDYYLTIGPTVKGGLFSKKDFGSTAWPSRRPVYVEIFDDNSWQELGNTVWEQSHLKAFSPINLTAGPYSSYVSGNTVWKTTVLPFDTPPTPKKVAFPWEGPTSYYAYTSPTHPKDPFGVANGVGPAQVWWVDPNGFPTAGGDPKTHLGSTPNAFRWQFGEEGVFGAPISFDGHVPQVLATWVDGLTSGRYFVRAWVSGYIQSDYAGNYVDYGFTITGREFPGNVFVPVDLRLGASMKILIHFQNYANTLEDSSIGGPDPGRYIIAEAYDPAGNNMAFNFTYLAAAKAEGVILLNGFGMAGPNNFIKPGGAGVFGMMYSPFRYRHIRDYGLPANEFSIQLYVRGYIQQSQLQVSVTQGSQINVSLHMLRGASINITVYSQDFEHPAVARNWQWPQAPLSLVAYRSDGTSMGLVKIWNGVAWITPTQTASQNTLPSLGGNPKLLFNGSSRLEAFGPDSTVLLKAVVEEGASLAGIRPVSGFLWNSTTYRDVFGIPTIALPTDGYFVRAFTYGYIQENPVNVFSIMGSTADIRLDLTIGVNLTLTIKFEKESLFTTNPFNMSMRVRIFDDLGELVAASATSSSLPSPFATPYIPGGVTEVDWRLAGFSSTYVEINQARYRSYGIAAAPVYKGGWTVEVDTVNWYLPGAFFPAADGLLMGESYHTIIGLNFGLTGSTWAFNHLGPWEQRQAVALSNAHLSGESSVVFSLDLRALVRGTVTGITYRVDARTISWGTINFASNGSTFTQYSMDGFYETYLDPGQYNMSIAEWTTKGEGHKVYNSSLSVPEGSRINSINVVLEESDIPIPEFTSTIAIDMVTTLILLAVLSTFLRRLPCSRNRREFYFDPRVRRR